MVKYRLSNLIGLAFVLVWSSCSNKMLFRSYLAESTLKLESNNLFYKDIPYDTKPLTKFDIVIPKSNKKVPLVIFIHGGGFSGGDKDDVYSRGKFSDEINELIKNGIAYATINYRLLGKSDAQNVMSCMNDAKKCLQFIRYHAKDFNIDEQRVGLYGGSAGAGTSLWLALSDNMQDKNALDPISKKSTRVKAIAAFATQATYDLEKWDDVFTDYNMTDVEIAKLITEKNILGFYGIKSMNEINNPMVVAMRKTLDLGNLISQDDPPLWIQNPLKTPQKPNNLNEVYHHYNHGAYLYKLSQKYGIQVYASFPAQPFQSENWVDVVSFFVKYL